MGHLLPPEMMRMNPPPNFAPLMPPMPQDSAPRSGVPLSEEQFYREQQRLLDVERRYVVFVFIYNITVFLCEAF